MGFMILFGFGGSVQAMITTLKNNARPKRSAFKSLKEYEKNTKHRSIDLKFKELSEKELQKVKEKIKQDALKQKRRENIYAFIVSTLLVSVTVYFALKLFAKEKEINVFNKQQYEARERRTEEQYIHYLNEGYFWIDRGEYHNAKYQFYEAIKMQPSDYRSNYAYSLAFVYDCMENSNECNQAIQMLNRLLRIYGDSLEVQDLKVVFEGGKTR